MKACAPGRILVGMKKHKRPPAPPSNRQSARLALRLGDRTELDLAVETTPLGLLALGGLTACVLLSTAQLVRAGIRGRARRAAERAPLRLPTA